MDKSIFISIPDVKVKMIFVSLPRVYLGYLTLDKFANKPGEVVNDGNMAFG